MDMLAVHGRQVHAAQGRIRVRPLRNQNVIIEDFSSRSRHTTYIGDWEFRRVLFRSGRAVLIAVNTTLSAAAGLLATVAISGFRFGKPDASLCANGWVGGLVASSAACAFVSPAAAVAIGLVAGTLVTVTVAYIEWPLAIDDPGGAISVHAAGGLWGVLALGIFARFSDSVSGQWLAQLVGIATL